MVSFKNADNSSVSSYSELADGTGSAVIEFTNNGDIALSVCVYIGGYNNSTLYSAANERISVNKGETVSIEIPITKADGVLNKMFVWTGNMKPFMDVTPIN